MSSIAKKRAMKKKKGGRTFDVVGLQYRVTKPVRRMLVEHLPFTVELKREPENTHDHNAIAVLIADESVPFDKMKLGYLRKEVAAVLASPWDDGDIWAVEARMIDIDPEDGIGQAKIWLNENEKSAFDKLGDA